MNRQAGSAHVIIVVLFLFIGVVVFYFPKADVSCAPLADGQSACRTHRCAGIFINETGITNIHHDCLGIDMGSDVVYD